MKKITLIISLLFFFHSLAYSTQDTSLVSARDQKRAVERKSEKQTKEILDRAIKAANAKRRVITWDQIPFRDQLQLRLLVALAVEVERKPENQKKEVLDELMMKVSVEDNADGRLMTWDQALPREQLLLTLLLMLLVPPPIERKSEKQTEELLDELMKQIHEAYVVGRIINWDQLPLTNQIQQRLQAVEQKSGEQMHELLDKLINEANEANAKGRSCKDAFQLIK